MEREVDAVLVGSGVNALAAALHLASKGWRVLVLERGPKPGGCLRTDELTVPGFRHDWAAMNLSLFAGGAFHKAHGAELARHGLAFVPVEHPFASAFPDGRWLGVSTDLEATAARIAAVSPADAATWRRLAASFPQEVGPIAALLGSPMTMRALLTFAWGTVRKRGVGGTLDLARFLLASPRRWLGETFESPDVRALLGAWGMHLDFAPDVAGGAILSLPRGHGRTGVRNGDRAGRGR